MLTFNHFNFNVLNMERSLAFYKEALNLTFQREKRAADGSYWIVFLQDEAGSPFSLELTELADRKEAYDLGEGEFHLAFRTPDFDAVHQKHQEMGIICFENPSMGIYFIEDPDGYWIEIIPVRR